MTDSARLRTIAATVRSFADPLAQAARVLRELADVLEAEASRQPILGDAEKLLTVAEVAERLSCSRSTVYEWLESGELNALKIGDGGKGWRVRQADLAVFIATRRRRHALQPVRLRPVRSIPRRKEVK